ncbi:MAG TPA: xanthine dehydrogenase molybdopterin binding subunit [Oculatellaceae cyanobacterium]
MGAIGKDIPHDSACGHVSGQSVYIDDIPPLKNELIVDFFGSPVAHCKILSVDLHEASKIPGIVGLFTYRDLGGINKFGPVLQDEVLLCEDHATFIGEPIVVIAGNTREAIEQAKKTIVLRYEELPKILTIDEAKAAKDFIDRTYSISRGDVDAALKSAPHLIEGTVHIGGQDHFYLESHAALVYPGENDQLVVHSSTQAPSEVQQVIARVLGLQQAQVVVLIKRMGGGFGGKETQASHPAAMASLVALKTKRPARIIYNKDDDMKYTGKRHSFQNDYKVGFDEQGRILAVKAHLYANGGAANDLSTAVVGRALTHMDNAYYAPNVEVHGTICRTNYPPTTAFRGFGGPQGIATIENILEEIAAYLKKDPYLIRRLNCYGIEDRNTTHYGQLVENNTLPAIFDELHKTSDYEKRYQAVQAFNRTSKTKLRGICMSAVKFGISFTTKFLNQANALVNVYLDGTVQVSTGATEMGQGVNTNIKQLVADEFSIPHQHVVVMTTSTEKNNNTSATAASSATDLNGSAAVVACQTIKRNMAECVVVHFGPEYQSRKIEPDVDKIRFVDSEVFDQRMPGLKLKFVDLVGMAYRDRRHLGEKGFYATPHLQFDWLTGQGRPFLYYTSGCAVAEVEIDRFTGDLKILGLDVLMDIGKEINPGINRGQIIGAVVQGIGWATTEELRYDANGALLSHSPTTYKIPNIQDIPDRFNVAVVDNETNASVNVHVKGTKAVGEPPLCLGLSVWLAVKQALSFVSGEEIPRLALPATNEQILSRLSYYKGRRWQEHNGKHDVGVVSSKKDESASVLLT